MCSKCGILDGCGKLGTVSVVKGKEVRWRRGCAGTGAGAAARKRCGGRASKQASRSAASGKLGSVRSGSVVKSKEVAARVCSKWCGGEKERRRWSEQASKSGSERRISRSM